LGRQKDTINADFTQFFGQFFWCLNGLDKFFDGVSKPNRNSYAAKSVLVDANDKVIYTQYPMEPTGYYGVSRENKMVGYFKRLKIPRSGALVALYGFSVTELLLGLGFAILVLWSFASKKIR